MKNQAIAIFFALLSSLSHATTYETAEDRQIDRWRIFDSKPAGASISNVYDSRKESYVIQLSGKRTRNGYIIGDWKQGQSWNNTEEANIRWSMRYSENFIVYISIQTLKGYRFLYYTASNKDKGIYRYGPYIHHGLGAAAKDGKWHNITRNLQADLQSFEKDNKLIAVDAFLIRGSGKIDDIELTGRTVTDSRIDQQRLIADQFISIFENGTTDIQYAFAKDIGDGRGITAGRAGFTSATGDMLTVIEKYSKIKPDNSLAQYTDELKVLVELRYKYGDRKKSASTENLKGLINAWKENSQYQIFRTIQDEVVDEFYFKPALEKARQIGAKLPLTILSLYDANIMHGESGLDNLVTETIRRSKNRTPKEGIDEITWLKKFNQYRKEIMRADHTWSQALTRVTELEDLIKTQNYQLQPFKMVIQDYEDETHYLPDL